MLDTSKRPIEDLIQQLNIISNEDFDNEASKVSKTQLGANPMKNALFSELFDIKRRLNISSRTNDEKYVDVNAKLLRLDNMLVAEGVIGQDLQQNNLSEKSSNVDYQMKLVQIRDSYQKQICQYEKTESEFAQQVALLIQDQQQIRPITDQEMRHFVDMIRHKFIECQIKIKQVTCESLIEFKSKFFDARRKRRNFTKHTTDILNNYFNTHIENPYPDDATKEALARQCNITVGQVTNWFGNKRIRYKKSIPRMQREAVAERQAVEQASQFEMLNAANLMNPYMFAMNPDLYSSSSMTFPNSNPNYN